MFEVTVIVISGFLCGVLNAVAGGGTFVTLPALVWLGVPPIAANATATTTAVPGYIASAWAYRHSIKAEGSLRLRSVFLIAAVGGVSGALLLIVTADDSFLAIVPWLLLFATILFAFAPKISSILNIYNIKLKSKFFAFVILFLVTTYGGYFNGGLGVVVLAALSLLGHRNLHSMNGLKSLLAAVLSLLSVITFIAADLIVWEVTSPMIVGNIIGAFTASHFVQGLKRTDWLRIFIIGIGFVISVLFFSF